MLGPDGVSVISQVCSTESMYSTGAFPFLGPTQYLGTRVPAFFVLGTLWLLKAAYVLAPGQSYSPPKGSAFGAQSKQAQSTTIARPGAFKILPSRFVQP